MPLAKGLGAFVLLKVSIGALYSSRFHTNLGAIGAHLFDALLLTFLLDKHTHPAMQAVSKALT